MSLLTTFRRSPVYSTSALSPLFELQREFESYLGRNSSEAGVAYSPSLDVREDEQNIVATLDVPGFNKADVQISFHDKVLTISGERKVEETKKEGTVHVSERVYGKFQRSVYVPIAVDAAAVTAVYKDGVLTVTLPKAAEAKPKQINITVN